jgi:CubicO group peptidase (beta-lactamase class C family)
LQAQTIPSQKLDSLFVSYEKEGKLFANAELVQNSKVLYNYSIGKQDIKSNKNLDSLTIFPIGRFTELFVQTLLFQMEENGKLKLSNRLSDYYPEIPNSGKITLENLMYHQSGLSSTDSLFIVNTREKVKQFLKENSSINGKKYSNLDYILLGFVLEDVSKENFSNLLKNNIIQKLNLQSIFYDEPPLAEQLAVSYSKRENEQWKKTYYQNLSDYKTASGLYASLHDLEIFVSALFEGKLFGQKYVNKYIRVKDNKKRLSFYCEKTDGKEIYSINRNIKNFEIQVKYVDKNNLCAGAASNAKDNVSLDFIINNLLNAFYDKPIQFPKFSLMEKWKNGND